MSRLPMPRSLISQKEETSAGKELKGSGEGSVMVPTPGLANNSYIQELKGSQAITNKRSDGMESSKVELGSLPLRI
jgi:hypothetical protein